MDGSGENDLVPFFSNTGLLIFFAFTFYMYYYYFYYQKIAWCTFALTRVVAELPPLDVVSPPLHIYPMLVHIFSLFYPNF